MTYKILSYGPTLRYYKRDKWQTIGVNHIFGKIETDYLVVIDNFDLMTQDQFTTICRSTPKKFFAWHEVWNFMQTFTKIRLNGGVPTQEKLSDLSTIDDPKNIPFSNNSPFVATIMAYHMGAKKIILYGVDFGDDYVNDHPNVLPRATDDFKALRELLAQRGCELYVCSNESRLSEVLPVYVENTPQE